MTEHPHEYQPQFNILKVPADLSQPVEFTKIDNNLQAMRDAIGGGYIEIVRNPRFQLPCGCHINMVVDEEGTLKEGMLQNPRVISFYPYTRIMGDAFFIAEGYTRNIDGEEDLDLVSLPDFYSTWEGPDQEPPTE